MESSTSSTKRKDNDDDDDDEIIFDNSPLFRLYKSGRMERLGEVPPIPPSLDPKTRVKTNDIKIISSKTRDHIIPVRLFKPNIPKNKRIPLLVYFHGGGFCIESTFSPKYHNYLNKLASEAQVMIFSVEYRLIPEHPLPAAYHDCWDALKWVVFKARDEEEWIQEHVDFDRVYLMGDSAGGNIAHRMALLAELDGDGGGVGSVCCISGVILVHPYFWGKQRIGDEAAKCSRIPNPDLATKVWALACPESGSGVDDPWINPGNDPDLWRLGCKRVLVCVAEKDFLRDRGLYYKEALEKSGWQGTIEVVESKGVDHVFHLLRPFSANSLQLMAKVVAFLNPTRSTL
ncbi:hypothetical protein SOVF_168730 [Spinacia oleracea]|uniref:Probable carboxylesterase 7 n=1 Tax=Spinacia oleracea TaxID=3562 RepID=A0A9R0IFZ3_SPIOL|nr:probable carboxylesterase 7 [Spinacia oleracea]KNA07783.1 hypothetical protein SOVF_168730 [Spinacia oleracea]